MRKVQSFVIYPFREGDKYIKVQSDNRIAAICPETGKGVLSDNHKNGAHFVHLQHGRRFKFELTEEEFKNLKMNIITSGGEVDHNGVVKADNSGAASLISNL